MSTLQPIPAFINETAGADRGLICGFQIAEGEKPREIPVDGMVQSLARRDVVTWLHFNLSEARARRWLLESHFLPAALRELLHDQDDNRRVEWVDDGVLVVMSDFTYEDASDPSEVATLWCFASRTMLITARMHPLRSSDELRSLMRGGSPGSTVTAVSGLDLIAQLFDLRTARLRQLASGMAERLDDIEDEILAGDIKEQREHLGRTRRLCARLRRQFVPERMDWNKFLRRPPPELEAEAGYETVQSSVDSLGFAIEEVAELYERAKLLQEELASRLAENTGRNLYVLSLLTAVLLPMTLVTGIFGMNLAGLPGAQDPHAFWRVMLLVIASGVATLAALFWRRLL